MRNQTLNLVRWGLFCYFLSVLLGGGTVVSAYDAIDISQQGSITLHYEKDGVSIQNVSIRMYRVAQVSTGGRYSYTSDFVGCEPFQLNDIASATEWNQAAKMMTLFLQSNERLPIRTFYTDSEGLAVAQGLETGLYLVQGESITIGLRTYTFSPFLLTLPGLASNGSWQYHVTTEPKIMVSTKPIGPIAPVFPEISVGLAATKTINDTTPVGSAYTFELYSSDGTLLHRQ